MKFLKYFFILVIFIAAGGILIYLVLDEPLPEASENREAGLIALDMLEAVHFNDWQRTAVVSWTSSGKNNYIWDKTNDVVFVKWDNYEVVLNTNRIIGKATTDGLELKGIKADRLIKEAWKKWKNDSFWLNAPAAVMDDGVKLQTVMAEDSSKQLLVTYNNGNSYLWQLEANGLPENFKIWDSEKAIGGIKATWENWTELSSGAMIATKHKTGFKTIEISNLKDGGEISEFGLEETFFKPYY